MPLNWPIIISFPNLKFKIFFILKISSLPHPHPLCPFLSFCRSRKWRPPSTHKNSPLPLLSSTFRPLPSSTHPLRHHNNLPDVGTSNHQIQSTCFAAMGSTYAAATTTSPCSAASPDQDPQARPRPSLPMPAPVLCNAIMGGDRQQWLQSRQQWHDKGKGFRSRPLIIILINPTFVSNASLIYYMFTCFMLDVTGK